jgi:hypothetical protein
MIDAGHAVIAYQNGRVKSIRLIKTAATRLIRIGEPTAGTWHSPRFAVRERLDCSGTVWTHRPRCLEYS